MAADAKESSSGTKVLFVGLVVVALGLVGLSVYLDARADRELTRLEDAMADYEKMVGMKRTINELRGRGMGISGDTAPQGDPLQFLAEKARQSQLPTGKFNLTRNQVIKSGAWQETPYTITMRAKKDDPISRVPVVDFLRLVEEQRPSIKSKSLNLTFEGDGFTAATITLSSFQKAPASAGSGRK